jgi:fumarate hydratase subunit alpha
MAIVFFELGMDVHINGGDLEEAINEGVRQGYEKGFLRKSVVKDPIDRINTKDNTPAVIHYTIAKGDAIKITVAPKGFGSENMSSIAMLTPSAGIEGVKNFVLKTVSAAGGNPCPPIIVGVGVGGTMEKCALLSKKALLRPLNSVNGDPFWKSIEDELLEKINALGIGPAGFGGRSTALGVNIETFPTHIAGLPVAVNIGCHVTRHAQGIL